MLVKKIVEKNPKTKHTDQYKNELTCETIVWVFLNNEL